MSFDILVQLFPVFSNIRTSLNVLIKNLSRISIILVVFLGSVEKL